jgi:hypothetical protein
MEEKLKANIEALVDRYIKLHKEKNEMYCCRPALRSKRCWDCERCKHKYYGGMRYYLIKKYSS